MQRLGQTFLRSICRPPLVYRNGLTLLALGSVLLLLNACAMFQKNEEVEYYPLIDTKFKARTDVAKLSNESEDTLAKKGYKKIGTVRANQITKRCDLDGKCEPVSAERDPTAAVLQKAASEGGDLVHLFLNNVPMLDNKVTKVCKDWTTIYTTQYYCPPIGGAACYNREVRQNSCTRWESETVGTIHSRGSAGSVWRY